MLLISQGAPGVDRIAADDLKLLADVISTILARCFNECIEKGEFPSCLKETDIVAIFKGVVASCNNYRPILVLPIIGKIFEKLINKRLLKIIGKTTKIDENQFGFQKKSSTDTDVL